ncbi:hypothetical protein OGAPHI_005685 [Ogataea philodendri]|uniref:Sulphur transport domain-containing protein n=1 Tax=Ogataea philodendri TaxID=1378263 RepID=A0A9P8T157_9ASCO|nr:uncharacterized protein OGAPHI_005685 [Ogataea philodendri]KAH3662433.1 hypothetical protein OGAPHI_005685 [Ogataea philodendri]
MKADRRGPDVSWEPVSALAWLSVRGDFGCNQIGVPPINVSSISGCSLEEIATSTNPKNVLESPSSSSKSDSDIMEKLKKNNYMQLIPKFDLISYFYYLTMFTPTESIIGAVLIHFATTSYLVTEGKIIGFSSCLYSVLSLQKTYNWFLIAGLLVAAGFSKLFLGEFYVDQPELGLTTSIVSGLLVGFGTSKGCGCTSGHMLGGLSRLRWRSFVATCVFSASAIATATVLQRGQPCDGPCYKTVDAAAASFNKSYPDLVRVLLCCVSSSVVLPVLALRIKNSTDKTLLTVVHALTYFNAGFVFGLGLFVAGMVQPSKVLGFLSILTPEKFDPSLLMIPLFTIVPNIIIWKLLAPQHPLDQKKPFLSKDFSLNFSNETPKPFIFGNLLFGVGWGLAGICPGPGIMSTVLNPAVGLPWVAAFFVGYRAAKAPVLKSFPTGLAAETGSSEAPSESLTTSFSDVGTADFGSLSGSSEDSESSFSDSLVSSASAGSSSFCSSGASSDSSSGSSTGASSLTGSFDSSSCSPETLSVSMSFLVSCIWSSSTVDFLLALTISVSGEVSVFSTNGISTDSSSTGWPSSAFTSLATGWIWLVFSFRTSLSSSSSFT